jgi:hypothetical protein
MKVRELIEALSKHPGDIEVRLSEEDALCDREVTGVKRLNIYVDEKGYAEPCIKSKRNATAVYIDDREDGEGIRSSWSRCEYDDEP